MTLRLDWRLCQKCKKARMIMRATAMSTRIRLGLGAARSPARYVYPTQLRQAPPLQRAADSRNRARDPSLSSAMSLCLSIRSSFPPPSPPATQRCAFAARRFGIAIWDRNARPRRFAPWKTARDAPILASLIISAATGGIYQMPDSRYRLAVCASRRRWLIVPLFRANFSRLRFSRGASPFRVSWKNF